MAEIEQERTHVSLPRRAKQHANPSRATPIASCIGVRQLQRSAQIADRARPPSDAPARRKHADEVSLEVAGKPRAELARIRA
jgi:hypothetical protein